jgi:hypothetical protein
MNLGSKSNLISAYCALFTVAFGILVYDHVRRSPSREDQPIAEHKTDSAQGAKPKPPTLAAR